MIWRILVLTALGILVAGGGCPAGIEKSSQNETDRPLGDAVTVGNVNAEPTPIRKDKKMSEYQLTQVKLTAKAAIAGEKLNVSYDVENFTDSDVYVWDGMIGFDGPEKVVENDRAYVYFEEPATVRIIRGELPSPTTIKVGVKQILFARLLKARSKLSAAFSLPYPLKEHSPYFEPLKEEEQELKKCSRIRLMVGWIPPKAGMKIDEREIKGEKWYKVRGLWEPPYQEIVEQYIPLDLDLFIYTSSFERQMPMR